MGDLVVPGARDRAISSLVSAAAAIALYLVVTIVLGGITVFLFARDGIGLAWGAQAGGSMKAAAAAVDARVPVWASALVVLLAGVVAWLGVARGGRGMVGDAVGSIRALGPDGSPASRGRTLLRAGVPVLVAVLGSSVQLGPTVLVLLVGCAVWAAVKADRRGPFEMVAGVRLESLDPVRMDREERRAQLRASRTVAQSEPGDQRDGS